MADDQIDFEPQAEDGVPDIPQVVVVAVGAGDGGPFRRGEGVNGASRTQIDADD